MKQEVEAQLLLVLLGYERARVVTSVLIVVLDMIAERRLEALHEL